MKIIDRYPIIVTPKLKECVDFYERYLGFEAGFSSTWFVWMRTPNSTATIAFMTPDHPSSPPGPQAFLGTGLCFEIHVESVASAYEELKAKGLRIAFPMVDEDIGQRRFGFFDPAGVWLDIVEQIEPAPGFWEPYTVAQ